MTALERIAAALERLADAEEQAVLAEMPASPPETAPAPAEIHPWDNVPLNATLPSPPSYTIVSASQPYQPPTAVTTIQTPPPWVCPIHHEVKMVPGGVSARTGKPYGSFLSCTDRECKHVADRCRVPGCRDV